MLPSNYIIIWENNRIKGIKLKEAMEYVSLTITIDKDDSTTQETN